eukprot:m.259858 g.259858  ORF g.259858 m.259858 type:complete len:782 (+) comp38816_c0_seq1:26-2371(+)
MAFLRPAMMLTTVLCLSSSVVAMHKYQDKTLPIDERVSDLISRMNLTQIIGQTWAPYGSGHGGKETMGVGSFSMPSADSPAAIAAARDALQKQQMAINDLKIPVSFSQEALHSAVVGGTVFPELVTQGSMWNTNLVEQIGSAIALECRAVGANVAFSPVINMWTDARFGRLQEGYTENPTLTAAYAEAMTKGLQGNQPPGKWVYFNSTKIVALAKHYAAYGAALGGMNGGAAELSEYTLREWWLRPWRAFAKAGGKAAMTAHNTVLNKPCHAHPYLVNEIFRKEYGFGDGFIISDCNDIPALVSFRTAANMSQAAAKGMLGGVDIDLQCGTQSAYTQLQSAIDSGMVNASVVTTAAERILKMKFACGLFDSPFTDPSLLPNVNSPQHQALALQAAEEGIVMLKNEREFLPLKSFVKKIAVVGPNGGCDTPTNCRTRANYLGSYTQWSDNATNVPTVAEALTAAYAGQGDVTVSFNAGADIDTADTSGIAAAVAAAKEADVVVCVVGDDQHSSAEWGDRDNLDLPGGQLQLLQAVAAVGKPVVLVLVTGRTATFGDGNAVLKNVTAIFSAFRPGQAGGTAIANLLMGKANPSGKLAQNWVRTVGQVGSGSTPWLQWRVGKWVANTRGVVDPDGRRYDNYLPNAGSLDDGTADPLFHFGDGLSYTNFSFSPLTIMMTPTDPDVVGNAVVEVKNTGAVAGQAVVQLYVQDPIMDNVRPWKRLAGFSKTLSIAAGASETVTIAITKDELSIHDDGFKLQVYPGDYVFSVGEDSISAAYNTLNVTI